MKKYSSLLSTFPGCSDDFFSCSVYEYLTMHRINKAKELLLVNSYLKVQDIARMTGFSDTSHFISMFKKATGMTPLEFRRMH